MHWLPLGHLDPQHVPCMLCTAVYFPLRQPCLPRLQQRLCLTLQQVVQKQALRNSKDYFQPTCARLAVNIARDSYASYTGHHPMLEFFAIAQNESIGRVRYEFLQKMLLPCGVPPASGRDED